MAQSRGDVLLYSLYEGEGEEEVYIGAGIGLELIGGRNIKTVRRDGVNFHRVDKNLIRALKSNRREYHIFLGYSGTIEIGECWIYRFVSTDSFTPIRNHYGYAFEQFKLVVDRWAKEIDTEAVIGVMAWAEMVRLPPGIEREMVEYLGII